MASVTKTRSAKTRSGKATGKVTGGKKASRKKTSAKKASARKKTAKKARAKKAPARKAAVSDAATATATRPAARVKAATKIAEAVMTALRGKQAGPAGPAVLIRRILEQTRKRRHDWSRAALFELGAEAADMVVQLSRAGSTLEVAAKESAATMAKAAKIAARDEEIFATFDRPRAPQHAARPGTVQRQLGSLTDIVSATGAEIAHDSWFAESMDDTVRGPKSNDLRGFGERGLRARPFFETSEAIAESGKKTLIDSVRKNNQGGIRATLAALVDAISGSPLDVPEDYLSTVKALPDPFADADTAKPKISAETLKYLLRVAAQLARAQAAFTAGDEPKWGRIPDAAAALAATHDRYVKNNPWAADEQKVHFRKLTREERARDVPILMATLHAVFQTPSVQKMIAKGI